MACVFSCGRHNVPCADQYQRATLQHDTQESSTVPIANTRAPPASSCVIYHAVIFRLACRRVSLAVFGHVLDLDLSFHLSRKTGEVTKVVDRGTAAIQNVLSTILFQIAPQVCV